MWKQRAGLWETEAFRGATSGSFHGKMYLRWRGIWIKLDLAQIRFGVENQGCYMKIPLYRSKWPSNGLTLWKNEQVHSTVLVCILNFLLPSAPRSSIDSLLSEARAICITYSPLALPVASSTVCSERSRPSWMVQLLGHVDFPVHGPALIASVYAGSGCVRSSLLSGPQSDDSL